MRKKIIIFAPHQDDEILACAGTIDLFNKLGVEVQIIFATNGDFYGKESAGIRLQESIAALKLLHICENNIHVLGYADTGMSYDSSFLWKLYHAPSKERINSPVSSVTYHPLGMKEYSMEEFGVHVPYCREAFLKTIEHLITSIQPMAVFTSSRFDAHGDHAALCLFIEEAIKNIAIPLPIYQYMIHSGNDKEWPERQTLHYNKPPNITEQLWKERITVSVDPTIRKKELIQIFQSQLSPSGYLLSFAKCEEVFFNTKAIL